jgi:hypothetical protein
LLALVALIVDESAGIWVASRRKTARMLGYTEKAIAVSEFSEKHSRRKIQAEG